VASIDRSFSQPDHEAFSIEFQVFLFELFHLISDIPAVGSYKTKRRIVAEIFHGGSNRRPGGMASPYDAAVVSVWLAAWTVTTGNAMGKDATLCLLSLFAFVPESPYRIITAETFHKALYLRPGRITFPFDVAIGVRSGPGL